MKPGKSLATLMLAHLVAISSNSKTISKILLKSDTNRTHRLPGFTSIPTQDIIRSSPSNTRDNRSPFLHTQPPHRPNNSSQYRPPSPRQAQTNVATTHPSNITWLLDSGASHHVTTDLSNLTLHSPYDGTDEIMIGDGSGLPISHTGSTSFTTPSHSFSPSNVLCVPTMKRFHQCPGVDYSETLVQSSNLPLFVLFSTLRLVSVDHSDNLISTMPSFRELSLRMCLCLNLRDRDHPYHVYKLRKAIYGLKQAPHACQRKYIANLLNRTHMTKAKPAPTPLATSPTLTLQSGTPLSNPTEYRTIIGSLQYLSLTRPDVTYTVNKLSQFMHQPTSDHWNTVKCLLWYLCGTLEHGITLRQTSPLALHAYLDADLACNKDDFTSISAYIVYLGHNPISWRSKKQRTMARSSTEAKYQSVASTAAEIRWIFSLLPELADQLADALTKPLVHP
ncbi:Detected protein of unknown function [Hibiscus syriacus]|uniref:Retrovirus-related Pol polyprotein from transposon TNT 1-94-like beta-barrel domain-containing protein n=1 Tax=Hibiscus syriacus TaxID=106335 RepID=A0A6A2YIG1_HIBSY|nr:Detected protein of unknown function [Hibiscus syriacus]